MVNSDTAGVQTHIVLKEGVSLSGGHDGAFSTRDTSKSITIITDMSPEAQTQNNPPPSKAIEAGATITTATVVDGFTINGSSTLGVTH